MELVGAEPVGSGLRRRSGRARAAAGRGGGVPEPTAGVVAI
jgi:hypothetical protein